MRHVIQKPRTLAERSFPRLVATCVAGALLLGVTTVQAGLTPEQKCQVGKNKLVGKYVLCRQNAEANRAKSADITKFTTAINKCRAGFMTAWQKLEGKAATAGASCLDGAATGSIFQPIADDYTSHMATALAGGALSKDCLGDLGTCQDDLDTCQAAVGKCGTCPSDLATCNTNLGTCGTDKAACTTGLGTCQGNLTGCEAEAALCGNGVINEGESCDGLQLAAKTCKNLGFASGTLKCTVGCGFDLTECVANTCGNNLLDTGEKCDGGLPGDMSCSEQTYCAQFVTLPGGQKICTKWENYEGGTIRCGSDCKFDTAGCYEKRFQTGTSASVIDNETGLEWEKKTGTVGATAIDCANTNACDAAPRSVLNRYRWTDMTYSPGGTAFSNFLGHLNGAYPGTVCLSDHCDWRLPTLTELKSIKKPSCTVAPCITSTSFGENQEDDLSDLYWSVETIGGGENTNASVIRFHPTPPGGVLWLGFSAKTEYNFVRAVRTR